MEAFFFFLFRPACGLRIPTSICRTSANAGWNVFLTVVGYNTVTVDAAWKIFAVNFEDVAGGALSIQDALPKQEGMVAGDAETGDQIQIQSTEGYDTYYLSNGYYYRATPVSQKGWKTYEDKVDKWVAFDAGWSSSPADVKLTPGTAFWYGSKKSDVKTKPYTVTVAGAVPGNATKTITIDKQWTHIANPYPFDLPLTSLTVTDGMTPGDAETGDQIQIQNAEGYDTYYLSNGYYYRATPVSQKGWKTYEDKVNKWVAFDAGWSSSPVDDTVVIPAGKGAWYRKSGSDPITITIENPVK